MQSFTKQEENQDLIGVYHLAVVKINLHTEDLIFPLKLPIEKYNEKKGIRTKSIDEQFEIWKNKIKNGGKIPKRPHGCSSSLDHVLIGRAKDFFRYEFDYWCEDTDKNSDDAIKNVEKWYYMSQELKELQKQCVQERNENKSNGEQMELI